MQGNPSYYTFNKKSMTFLDWCILYKNELQINEDTILEIIYKIENNMAI